MTTPTVTSSTDSQMHNKIMAAVAAADDSPVIPEHTTVETPMNIYKGKEIAKPITPPSNIAFEDDSDPEQAQMDKDMQKNLALIVKYFKKDSDPEQAQMDKDMQKNLALIAKYFKKIYKPTNNNLRTSSNSRNKNVDTTLRKPKRVKDSAYHNEKMLLCKQAEQGVPLQAKQYDWLADTDEEIDEQELEAHYSYMAKIQEVTTADTGTDFEPLEQVQNDSGYNVFTNDLKHSEQSEFVSNTCLVETDDSNVIPDSPDMCEDDIQNDQNDVESDDERVALANLIANLKLDAQSEIPCLYVFPYDQSTHANRLIPDEEKTLALKRESQSKLNKDLVRPYDYTTLNSLYEIFKPPTQEFGIQLAHVNEIRKKMWRKSFVKYKPNIFKNIRFLPVSKSISKSRQAYNVTINNINHFKEIVNNAWIKHLKNQICALTAQDMEILIQTCLMPLVVKTQNDSFIFVHELKQEMHAALKYVESLEKETDELEFDKAEFSNMYDMILQDCMSNDVMCSYILSLSDLDALVELQCLYLHKVKECDCLAQKLSKQTESVSKEVHSELLKCFSKVEKHSISIEIALQKCKEQVKNDIVSNERASNVFRKEREQYIEIQDLKAQLQDKNIAITSEEDNDPKQAQRDKDMQKNLALIAKNKRTVNVVGAREKVGSPVVQQSGIQCFNCKEFGHFSKECRKPKRVKDSAYHKEKMLMCKQAEQGVPLQAEQYDWLADIDEEVDE
nr:hypothetical protein [Tanacetum cinerariifolium]